MSAPRFTIRHDDRPAVELQNTSAGILVTTFGWPRTLSGDETERLHAALGGMIAARANKPSPNANGEASEACSRGGNWMGA